jgi:hypothetical protein
LVHGVARWLAKYGLMSRSEAERSVAAGRVSVNGKVTTNPDRPCHPERDKIAVDGKPLRPARRVFLAMHKGNDVNDLGCVRLAGCGLAVLDAHPLLKKAARGVLSHPGGRGAVREVAEMILFKLGHEIVYNASDRTR